MDKRLLDYEDLYICFPAEKTDGSWYLLKHSTLVEIAKVKNGYWFETGDWKHNGVMENKTPTIGVRAALEPYAYKPLYGSLCYTQARAKNKVGGCFRLPARISGLFPHSGVHSTGKEGKRLKWRPGGLIKRVEDNTADRCCDCCNGYGCCKSVLPAPVHNTPSVQPFPVIPPKSGNSETIKIRV